MRFPPVPAALLCCLLTSLSAEAQDIATPCNPLPPAVVNQPYTLALRQTGFAEAPRWLASTLPPGLSLSPESGLLSGTPTTQGAYELTIMAIVTQRQQAAAAACRLVVLPEASTLFITTSETLPPGSALTAYTTALAATGGEGPYQWSTAGETALPDGLTLSPEGRITGIPTRSGTFRFEATVSDSSGQSTQRVFLMTVNRAPSLELGQQQVTFSAEQGAATPSQTSVPLTSEAPIPFTVATTTSDGTPWLSATPAQGEAPSSLDLIADPTALVAGTYRGQAVLDTGAEKRSIDVTLQIAAPAAPPKLAVDPSAVLVSYEANAGTLTRTIRVLNTGSGALAFEASLTNAAGFQLEPASGSATPSEPATLTLSFDPSAGTATTSIEIRTADGQTASIPVSIQRLATTSVTPSAIELRAFSEQQVLPVFFRLRNESRRTIEWRAQSEIPNLTITPQGGTLGPDTPDQEIAAFTTGEVRLAPGEYEGTIDVTLPATSEKHSITLRTTVAPLGENGSIIAAPSNLSLIAPSGGSPVNADLLLQNPNTTAIDVDVAIEGAPWLSIEPARGTIRPGAIARLRITADPTNLPDATYPATLTVQSTLAVPTRIPFSFTVGGTCTAQALLVTQRVPAPNAAATVGTAVPFQADIQTNCGAPLVAGAVTVFFQNGDDALSLTHDGRGRWTGTYTPSQPGPSEFAIVASAANQRAASPQPAVRLGVVYGRILVGGNALPKLLEVYETASQRAGEPTAAPGSVITLRGRNLLGNAMRAESVPWPVQLGNLSILLNDRPVPLFGANAELAQVQLPFDLVPGAEAKLTARRGNAVSEAVALTLVEARPGILTADNSGTGLGRFRGADGRPIGARNPASPGETVTLLCSGLGAVSVAQEPGRPAAAAGVNAQLPVSVSIAGQAVQALSARLSTETTGVYEVRFTIPRNARNGPAVEVSVTAGSKSSPAVTIPINATAGTGAGTQ